MAELATVEVSIESKMSAVTKQFLKLYLNLGKAVGGFVVVVADK